MSTKETHNAMCSCIDCSVGVDLGEATDADRRLIDSINQESHEVSFLTDLAYYAILPEGQQPHFDDFYREAESTAYVEPFPVRGHYTPGGAEFALTRWGLDRREDAVFVINIGVLQDKLGRRPLPGDLVLAQDNPVNILYEVVAAEATTKRLGHYSQWLLRATTRQTELSDVDLVSKRDLEPFPPDAGLNPDTEV